MLSAAEWSAVGAVTGVVIALFGIYIAQRTGYLQISFMRRAHELSVVKATPKMGTSLRIEVTNPNGPVYPSLYWLVATVYNEGELAATALKGDCKLFSPRNEVAEQTIQINRDFLGSASPFDLHPCPIEGHSVTVAMRGAQQIRFNFEIAFEYRGLPDDEPHQYYASYEYDNKTKQMVRI